MALVIATLETSIGNILDSLKGYDGSQGKTQQDAIDKFKTDLSVAIDAYIKSAIVTVAAGIPVATTGSATAQTGVTTASGTGTIS
jgi:hypothetical protein